jgi:2-keto-4-pentenoate hydratase
VDEPDYGMIVDGMIAPNGHQVDLSAYIAPRVEPEIAFTLRHTLRGPGLTAEEVADAVESVVGVLEIIDSRIADWKIRLEDTIADNASSAGVVVGDIRLPLHEANLETLGVTVDVDDERVAHGDGAAVMGSPLNALLWVANRLGELGVPLEAGTIVLPGSVCASVPLSAGSRVRADFGILGIVETAAVASAPQDQDQA